MTELEAQIIFWAWVTVCFLDLLAGLLAGLEWWKIGDRLATRMAHILFSTSYRSFTTIIGLSIFGLNVRAKPWYLWVGLSAVTYKAYATWSWLLHSRGIINGNGWL